MPLEHIHPMIVHFPIVLALLALATDVWSVGPGKGAAAPIVSLRTGTVIVALGSLAAVVAFGFGDMAYDIAIDKGTPEAVLEGHEGWGTTTTFIFAAVAAMRLFLWWRGLDQKPLGVFLSLGGIAVVALMVLVTAYLGGHLVYGLGINIAPPQ